MSRALERQDEAAPGIASISFFVLSGYLNCPVVYYNRLTEEVVSTDRQQPVPELFGRRFVYKRPPRHQLCGHTETFRGTLVLSSVDGGTEYVDDAFNAVDH